MTLPRAPSHAGWSASRSSRRWSGSAAGRSSVRRATGAAVCRRGSAGGRSASGRWRESRCSTRYGLRAACAAGPELLLHEVRHVQQFREHRGFALRYVWETLRRGYAANAYEVDARAYAARRSSRRHRRARETRSLHASACAACSSSVPPRGGDEVHARRQRARLWPSRGCGRLGPKARGVQPGCCGSSTSTATRWPSRSKTSEPPGAAEGKRPGDARRSGEPGSGGSATARTPTPPPGTASALVPVPADPDDARASGIVGDDRHERAVGALAHRLVLTPSVSAEWSRDRERRAADAEPRVVDRDRRLTWTGAVPWFSRSSPRCASSRPAWSMVRAGPHRPAAAG